MCDAGEVVHDISTAVPVLAVILEGIVLQNGVVHVLTLGDVLLLLETQTRLASGRALGGLSLLIRILAAQAPLGHARDGNLQFLFLLILAVFGQKGLR